MQNDYHPINISPKSPVANEEMAHSEITNFLASPRKNLSDMLSSFALGGGVELLSNPVSALPVFRMDDLSGYNYAFQNKMIGAVRFGFTVSSYMLVQTQIFGTHPSVTTHYFNSDGSFAFCESAFAHSIAHTKEILMETNCPILNHLYNVLASEYSETATGSANTKRAHTIEIFLRKLTRTRKSELSVSKGIADRSIKSLNQKMMETDLDPVLTWQERREIFKGIKAERSMILNTKRRAHRINFITYQLPIYALDMVDSTSRFFKRPFDNFLGVLERIFIDPIRWFMSVVKGNLGYSIALGIYSPFTYFFITQPMNPHATWAVGKVRSAYIDTVERVKNVFDPATAATLIAANAAALPSQAFQASQNSLGSVPPALPLLTSGQINNYSSLKPSIAGILMAADVSEVEKQNWEDRMSNFKALQISYEQNLEVAPRLGRLEQMETQLNWPLIVESTWLETERYLDQISMIEANANEYSKEFLAYLHSERARADQMQVYLWDRNVRFILDHPYTMMDQSKEQTQMDYYVGRSFVLLRDMTQELRAKHSNLALPQGYDAIDKLGAHFQAEYKNGNGIFDRLKNNSALFAQKDAMNTKELRSYMTRQWEILFLLQNRAQEPSNFGLQLYNWSIRNAVWIMQSVYSAKREELMMIAPMFKKGSSESVNITALVSKTVKRNDSQFEALFHMMVLEYASIRKEIGENLKKDIEATQRMTLIGSTESFLKERESLLKSAKIL